jgi:predicted TIM-barrel fold metal-dependent hydrolase
VENLRQLPDFGFTFDLLVLARQLPLARALVRPLPEVTFVLDHCGVPDINSGVLDPWREHITALADAPNVHCKVSGLVAYTDPSGWTVDDLRPWFNHVVDAFGWERIVWGGDWPVCTLAAPLSRWVAASHELTAHATEDQRARFFHANAERLYRL